MPGPSSARGVDCHAHVFSSDAPAIPGARYRPAYRASLEQWRAHWAGAGITHGVLVQPSFLGTDNREMLAALAADPGHLRGVAVLDPAASNEDIARLHEAGVRAIRLNLFGVADYAAYASAPWAQLLDRIGARGWHVEVFVACGRLPEIVPALQGRELAVVFDHFGNPGTGARLEATFAAAAKLARAQPVHCKLSGPYRLEGDAAGLAQRWIGIVGMENLVWGSDWPWTGHEGRVEYPPLRAELDRWIGEEGARAVLWDNAAALYGFR
jgi:predicted TIM-barrel fold metal-dependent hydrolase